MIKMQKLALFAGAVVMALGVSAASSSAFAMGCLDNQSNMVAPSLVANFISSAPGGAGAASALPPAYDVSQYNADLAKGNACSTTQQSLPLDQQNH
jgi:hypothetical protein